MRHLVTMVGFALLSITIGCGDGDTPGGGSGGNTGGSGGGSSSNTVELKVLDFDGTMKLIKSHQGKIVVVDVWSSS